MKEKQTYDLYVFKKATYIGICLGFTLTIFSIFENGFNYHYVLTLFGIAIMAASIVTFGFGMFINLLDETSDKSRGNNTHPCKDNVYLFLEKRRYYFK